MDFFGAQDPILWYKNVSEIHQIVISKKKTIPYVTDLKIKRKSAA